MKTAVIIGSTGLVGKDLVKRLAESSQYAQVLAISRKSINWESSKVKCVLFDFNKWEELEAQIKNFCSFGEIHGFCALGTTIKEAGSQDQFKKVDLMYPMNFAKLLNKLNAEKLVVVSALGADLKSNIFYNRVKGQMESELTQIFSKQVAFVRPSLLLGHRDKVRLGERISEIIFYALKPLFQNFLKAYCPIKSDQVAKAMIKIAENKIQKNVFENEELLNLS